MAIKTIEYKVNIAGITPATEQFGGTQGDHKVTMIEFVTDDLLNDEITDYAEEINGKAMYRFDVYDGEGGMWSSEPKELEDYTLSMELEERHTRYGGKVTIYLVFTVLSSDCETEIELYSFPAVLRLKNRPEGTYQEGENYESVTSLAEVAKSNALAAEKTNKELQAFAAQIEEKLKNGDFDGVGVESAVIINGELIITYSDGTVQNLGNVKGDTGPQGEKGDKGDAGKDAVTDQTYNPESENAQSGKAVAQAVDGSVPKKKMSALGAPFSSVLAVDNFPISTPEGISDVPNADSYQYIDVVPRGILGDIPNYKGTIPIRDDNGNLFTGEPKNDVDCANKEYVDGGFVKKVKGNGHTYQVYAIGDYDNEYNDTTLDVENNGMFEHAGEYGEIPCRQSNGNLFTNEPVKDLDCANKKYVDDLVGDIDSVLTELHNYAQALIGGNS